ncbi:MAG: TusE/DsrC/DsvC family sulfur relay protein [Leptothrix ochracea]|uniref:TusE/DsrC/DsvC family sulfur relay protein n=1 Tax=Leptothrix ochracea TaxID=735331 RepID=UPI0034E1BE9F
MTPYEIDGQSFDTDEDGYLLEANYSDDAVRVIAAADGIELTEAHWQIVNYLRETYREEGQTPNFRHMLKAVQDLGLVADSKALYDLFPMGPAKQGVKIAGLPKPFGKGGY